MYVWKVSPPEHITDGKTRVKNLFLHFIACDLQARTTVDLFSLSVTGQSNDVFK